jgi:hypothetical protein
MWSWWIRHFRPGDRGRRVVGANASAWASPMLVCALAGAVALVPLGLQPAEGSADGSGDASNGTGPPPAVVSCLASPSDEQRASCFAALGTQSVRSAPPDVAACLGVASGAERGSCFAAMGRRRGGVPERVAGCLAERARTQRASCFAALRGRDRVIGARVARCLARPTRAQRAKCLRREFP